MKHKILTAIFAVLISFSMWGCNKAQIDTVLKYDYAYISLPSGEVIEGAVENWLDFEDGDQIQVKVNGKTYLTHITNVVLVKSK